MADVTLADLIAWETSLRLVHDPADQAETTPVAWVVSARAAMPMLPPLRGGEIVLVPERVAAVLTEPLPQVLASLASAGVAAAILTADPGPVGSIRLPIVIANDADATGDIESLLNRSLTELRGELYRSGTDLGRAIAPLAATGSRADALLAAASASMPIEITLVEGRESGGPATATRRIRTLRPGLAIHATGDPRMRALAELALETLAEPVQDAIRRDEDARPRGAQRAVALHRLLASPDSESREPSEVLGRRLGLNVEATYVAAAFCNADIRDMESAFGRIGAIHDAGSDALRSYALIEVHGPMTIAVHQAIAAAIDRLAALGCGLALSKPHGIDGLAEAGREVRYVSSLQQGGQITARAAAIMDVRRLGAYSLLYTLRQSREAAAYAMAVLGDLPAHDRKGELRRTLRIFLESGGAHGEAADRLGIHRNTLAYRLRRIAALVGVDIANPVNWLTLHLALLASTLPDEASANPARSG